MATKLFIPGPTEVAPEVLAAMSLPMMGHRSKVASELQRRISDNLRRVLLTKPAYFTTLCSHLHL